jgi:tRNA(fMet)-specific endonuclease VapC
MIRPGRLIVLDTTIVVHLARGRQIGKRIATDHDLLVRAERPIISIVSVGKILSLALKWRWGPKQTSVLQQLLRELLVLDLRRGEIAGHYARIDHFVERELKPAQRMGQNDMWIAATAVHLDAVLISADGDFRRLRDRFVELIEIDPLTGATRS